MDPLNFYLVPVPGGEVPAARYGDQILVPMRAVCRLLHIGSSGQRIKARHLPGVVVVGIVCRDTTGRLQDQLCMDLGSLANWLRTISPRRISSQAAGGANAILTGLVPALEQHFQREASLAPTPANLGKLVERVAALEVKLGAAVSWLENTLAPTPKAVPTSREEAGLPEIPAPEVRHDLNTLARYIGGVYHRAYPVTYLDYAAAMSALWRHIYANIEDKLGLKARLLDLAEVFKIDSATEMVARLGHLDLIDQELVALGRHIAECDATGQKPDPLRHVTTS